MTTLPALRALLIAYNPRFATVDYSTVSRWLADGANLDLDVLPVIREWTARKADIYSLGFFTGYVREARDARLNAPRPPTDEERARMIAFVTGRLGWCRPAEERWLEAFEAGNGAAGAGVHPP